MSTQPRPIRVHHISMSYEKLHRVFPTPAMKAYLQHLEAGDLHFDFTDVTEGLQKELQRIFATHRAG